MRSRGLTDDRGARETEIASATMTSCQPGWRRLESCWASVWATDAPIRYAGTDRARRRRNDAVGMSIRGMKLRMWGRASRRCDSKVRALERWGRRFWVASAPFCSCCVRAVVRAMGMG